MLGLNPPFGQGLLHQRRIILNIFQMQYPQHRDLVYQLVMQTIVCTTPNFFCACSNFKHTRFKKAQDIPLLKSRSRVTEMLSICLIE